LYLQITAHKKARRETGGGEEPQEISDDILQVISIVPAQMNDIPNPFDGDASDPEFDIVAEFELAAPSSSITPEVTSAKPITVPDTAIPVPKKRKMSAAHQLLIDMDKEESKSKLELIEIQINNEKRKFHVVLSLNYKLI